VTNLCSFALVVHRPYVNGHRLRSFLNAERCTLNARFSSGRRCTAPALRNSGLLPQSWCNLGPRRVIPNSRYQNVPAKSMSCRTPWGGRGVPSGVWTDHIADILNRGHI